MGVISLLSKIRIDFWFKLIYSNDEVVLFGLGK